MAAANHNRRRRTQSVWFVRYGLTEHPLVEDLGPYDSDIDPHEGIDHAVRIAKRIASGLSSPDDKTNDDTIPSVVYASPFLRTAHTGYIVANELRHQCTSKSIELRLEEGLWEWLIPSLLVTKADGIKTNPRPVSELATILPRLESERILKGAAAAIQIRYQSVNPYDDSGDVDMVCVPERSTTGNNNTDMTSGRSPRWTESEGNLLERCETTLSRLISSHNSNGDSICIVSHAPCDQAMAYSLEKAITKSITAPKDSKLTPWPLGGITVFSRPILYENDNDTKPCGFGDWTMDLYGDTEHMPGDYKTGLKKWSLPCFT